MEAVKKESKVSQMWNKVKTKIISILKNKSSLFYYVLILIGFGIAFYAIKNIPDIFRPGCW